MSLAAILWQAIDTLEGGTAVILNARGDGVIQSIQRKGGAFGPLLTRLGLVKRNQMFRETRFRISVPVEDMAAIERSFSARSNTFSGCPVRVSPIRSLWFHFEDGSAMSIVVTEGVPAHVRTVCERLEAVVRTARRERIPPPYEEAFGVGLVGRQDRPRGGVN
ncbi:hypothetical protein SAMN05444354_109285 [Stigmatella aurantiaca]|uniref:Uncharacterized protein n=1 Tax=Stigmatella aurantiaca TaxID=41 RepID=A0A1H7U2Z2_STIAU|nr:hypothetical protein [Stigmatella aurantiaca]SEL91323.1 hypothetical protein SAMN05444354_109285 [Stigmatella aurantiaca]